MRRLAAPETAIWLLLTILALAAGAQAQSETVWWPQLDTFFGLTPNVRLMLLAKGNINTDTGNQQMVLGPNFDFFLFPFPAPKIKTLDKTRNYFVNFRLGYRYVATLGDRSSHTHRGLMEATPRFPLPGQLVLGDRNQLVLIGQEKLVSWLYRNRLMLARSFEVRSLIFTPYVQGQVVYNSQPGAWRTYNTDIGSVFRLTAHVELDPYFQHVGSIDGSSRAVNGMGLKLELFFHDRKDQ
ncbi:MAG: hypothetical protein WCC87_05055 [Candidatus Korobacteraceae bacterium]